MGHTLNALAALAAFLGLSFMAGKAWSESSK